LGNAIRAQAIQRRHEAGRRASAIATAPPATAQWLEKRTALRPESCACGGSCPRCQQGFPLQTKLEVGDPGDALEQEADRVADQVMRMPESSVPAGRVEASEAKVQRRCTACPGRDDDLLENQAPRILDSGGSPLGSAMRRFFESRFRRDLSAVRIHTGLAANEYCDRLRAHAFTYGNHVWLAKGATASASFVMAHELAHVVQQTQPPSLKSDGGSDESAWSRSARKPPNIVQRLPFWVPLDTRKGTVMTGADIHKELLEKVKGKNGVQIEAPVPNAIRNAWGLGLQGFADMYRASSLIGVFFKPRAGLSNGDKYGEHRHTTPAKPERAGAASKPVFDGKVIRNIGEGPKAIEVGELKPAATSELSKGDTQLGFYTEGFRDAAALTNLWAKERRMTQQWSPAPVTRLPASAVKFPASNDRDLALADIEEKPDKGGTRETVKYSTTTRFLPKPYLGEHIRGRLFAEHYKDGVWTYWAKPNNLAAALQLPRFKKEETQAYMLVASRLQTEVIGKLKTEHVKTLRRRGDGTAQAGGLRRADSIPKIRRKPKDPQLKDEFDYKTWSRVQTELGNQVRGEGTAKGSSTAATFKKLEFLRVAAAAEREAAPRAKTADFPSAAELKATIETGTGTQKMVRQTSLEDIYGWADRWTSEPFKILGLFRERFGSVFVRAINAFTALKETVGRKVQAFFEKHPTAKKAGKVLFEALKTTLKQVVQIIVPHTLHLVFEAVSTGIKKKLAHLFDDTFVEQAIDKFETWYAEIKDYGEQAKAYLVKVEARFLGTLPDWVGPLLSDIGWFWRVVKTGRVLLKCRKPPILGCLALLKSEASDHELKCVLCIPWVQKQIAGVVLGVSWFTRLPVTLGNVILETLRDAVPAKAALLRDVFSETIPGDKPDIEQLVPECNVKCTGFGLFKTGGPGGQTVSEGDAAAAEKMAEFAEKLGEEQLEELLKEADRQGMLDKPFDQARAEEMLKELDTRRKREGAMPPPPVKAPQEPQPPARPQQTRPPKSEEQKQREKKAREADRPGKTDRPPKEGRDPGEASKAPRGGGAPVGGACAWDPSMLRLDVFILEPRVDGGSNILHVGWSDQPSSGRPIERDCVVSLKIKNDFRMGGCYRRGIFTKPQIATEIRFNDRVLFSRKDDEPWANGYLAEPEWGAFIPLPPIREPGVLHIKMTMYDPDTRASRVLSEKTDIRIITKDKCCDCIS
jgi:hypothetical protein